MVGGGMFTVSSGSQGRFGPLQRRTFTRENFFLLPSSTEDRAKKKFSRPAHHIATVHSLSHMFGILVIGIWILFGIWDLGFGILPSWAEAVSSTELIEKAKEYDNRVVKYQGEVVGDVMRRGDFAWVNLNDGKNAIGIWGRYDLISPLVKYKGGYNYKGDTLKAIGVFHRACPEHGGDLDIHLDEIVKVRNGFLIPHPINFVKVIYVIGLSVVALGLSVLCALKIKRK